MSRSARIRRTSKTALISLMLGLLSVVPAVTTAEQAQAVGGPFTCSAQFYQATTTNSSLYASSIVAGKLQYARLGTTTQTNLNAIGYNTADNYIYGIGGSGTSWYVYKVDSAGTMTKLGSTGLTGLTASPGSGDFVAPNKLLVINNTTANAANNYLLIDVTTLTVTPIKNNGPASYPTGAGDWAVSGTTGYGMASSTIYKFDMTHVLDSTNPYLSITSSAVTADATPLTGNTAVAATSSTGFGAAYLDRSGNVFFYDNGTAKVFEITAARLAASQYQSQLVGGAATTPSLSAPNDGASCPNAPSPYDPPTPGNDTYTTVWDTTLTSGTAYNAGAFTTATSSSFPKLMENDSWNANTFGMYNWKATSAGSATLFSTNTTDLSANIPGTASAFTTSDGTFTFTPTRTGTGTFYYNLLETGGSSAAGSTNPYATVTVNVLGIGSLTNQNPAVNSPFSYQVATVGNGTGYTYSMTGCAPGLSISSTGLITGTPTTAGTYSCVVTLTVNGKSVSKTFTITPASSSLTLNYNVNAPVGATAPSTPSSFTTSGSTTSTTLDSSVSQTGITGYNFAGWNTAADGSGTMYAAGTTYTPVQATTTLYGIWQAKTVTVVWQANGGTNGPANQTFTYPTNVTTPPSGPTPPAGYTFRYWSSSSSCNASISNPQNLWGGSSSITFYACYTAVTYNVTYNLNGGSAFSASDPSTTFTVASGYTITTTTAIRNTYNFLGWFTAATGGTMVSAGSPWTTPGVVTFYAQWGQNTYSVGYDANGGTGAPADSFVADGSHVTVAGLSTLQRAGYHLIGWNTKADGSGDTYSPGDTYTLHGAGVTFYAQWVAYTYVITYDANGGSGIEPNTAFTVATPGVISSNTFTRNGYTFAGWWNTNRTNTGTAFSTGESYGNPVDLQLFAVWVPNNYTISYNSNGATTTTGGPAQSTNNEVVYAFGTNPAILGAGSWALANARFGGWNTAANGSGYSYNATDIYPAAANLTLYAQWIPLGTYVVTYDPNGGVGGPANQRFTEGGSVTIQGTAPTREGYDFAGWWNSTSSGSGATYAPGDHYRTLANLTLFAQWIPHSWDVAYDANGGTGNAPLQQHFTIPYTVTISAGNGISRTGYMFDGWNTEADGSGEDYAADDIYNADHDLLLYAVWTPVEYEVTYDSNGADFSGGTAPATETLTVETATTISGNVHSMTKTDNGSWTFAGWNTRANGSGTSYTAGSRYELPADLDLYAIWIAPSTYAVTYDPNGGSLANGQVGTQTFTTSVTVQAGTPVRPGYTFNGWNTHADGSGNEFQNPDVYSTHANLALYADWQVNSYEVIYDDNGGTGIVAPQTFDAENPAVIRSTNGLSRPGYTIAGWWNSTSAGTGSTFAPGDHYRAPSNLTLYAIWVANNYEITYDLNGGVGTTPVTSAFDVEHPAMIANGHNFRYDGKKFVGWSSESSTVEDVYAAGDIFGEPRDLLLYAIWEDLEQFTVTYDLNGSNAVSAPMAQTFLAGSSVTIASALSPNSSTGITFAGWNTNPLGNGRSFAAGADIYSEEADLLLYAIWLPIEYKVTYGANGGAGATPTPSSFDIFHPATIKDLTGVSLARPGYSFVGWNTAPDGSGNTYAAGDHYSTGGGDLHLYAIWDAEGFTLSYDLNEGDSSTAVPSQSFTVASPAAITSSTPTRAGGFSFRGWNTLANGSGFEYTTGDTFNTPADSIIYAQWVPSSLYEVDYNTHGGTPNPLHEFFQTTGSPIVHLPNPATITRAGYHLLQAKWCTATSGGTCIDGETATVTSNVTYHLQWAANTVTMTYNFNAGSSNVMDGNNHSSPATLPSPTTFTFGQGAGSVTGYGFWRPGYAFDGWNTARDGTGESFNAGDGYADSNDITLYAMWTLQEYLIEYDANGGEGTPPEGSTFTVESPGQIQSGSGLTYPWQVFQGWNTAANGSGQSFTSLPSSYSNPSNLLLFAQWGGKKDYTITYDANGGSGAAPGPYTFNIDNVTGDTSTITIQDVSTIFSRSGYTFLGLNSQADGSGTLWEAGDLYTDSESVTFYAQWHCDSCGLPAPVALHRISYSANGGAGLAPGGASVVDGSNYTIESGAGIVRDGYTFVGWNTAPNGSGNSFVAGLTYRVASNVTLYAIWKLVEVVAAPTGGTQTPTVTPAPAPTPPTNQTPVPATVSNPVVVVSGTLTRHVTEKKVIPNQIVTIVQTVALDIGDSKVKDILVNGKPISTDVTHPDALKLPILVGPKDKVIAEVTDADGTTHQVAIKKSNEPIELANVNFNLASHALTPAAKVILDKVIAVVKQHGFTYVNLIGYTDSQGLSSGYDNNTLSVNRAKEVKAYLLAHLGKKVTVHIEGKAHINPVASNQTAAGQAANRRVEIDVH